jgi:hypothetical protein
MPLGQCSNSCPAKLKETTSAMQQLANYKDMFRTMLSSVSTSEGFIFNKHVAEAQQINPKF